MPRIRSILSRAPKHQIASLIPESVDDVLTVIENESVYAERRTDIALRVNPSELLLRNKKSRDLLFKLLKQNEAQELVEELDLDKDKNPYSMLMNSRYYRGSERESILFDFFEVRLPSEENEGETTPGIISIDPEYGLFTYQRDVANRVLSYLDSKDNRAFLHMPTGSGKTRITMSLVSNIIKTSDPGLVLWLAEGKELLDQAAKEFEDAWTCLGDRELQVSRFYGDYDWQELDEGFMVAGLQKLWNKEKKSAAFLANLSSKVSLVVFDEAHRSVADTYQKILERLTDFNPYCRLLGLSATPGRTYDSPKEDRKLAEMYHQNKVSIDVPEFNDPFEYLISEGYLSNPEFIDLKMNNKILSGNLIKDIIGLEEGQEYPSRVLKRLAVDDLRNIRIIQKIRELINQGHTRIILFATTVDHAKIISAVLKALDIESSVITSETPSYIRSKEIKHYKKDNNTPRVLCNYNVLTTGFDAPSTSAAVIARPTTSLVLYTQMVGRAIRGPKMGGTEKAEIWTVIDTDLPGFGDLTEAFWNWEDVW